MIAETTATKPNVDGSAGAGIDVIVIITFNILINDLVRYSLSCRFIPAMRISFHV